MSTLEIILVCLLGLLFVLLICGMVIFFLKKNEIFAKQKYSLLNQKLKKQAAFLDQEINDYRHKLIDLSNKSETDIENEIKNNFTLWLKDELIHEVNEYKSNLQMHKTEIIKDILINSYQNILEESIHQSTTSIIKLDDLNLKGRIIGKDGRNKKLFEYLTGADLVIDKTSDFITIASLNPIRRTIATNIINELIKAKNIEPSKIESLYEQETKKFNEEVYFLGKKTCEEKLHVTDLNEKIYPYIGRLNYRSSYSQNILTHSLECAFIAQKIAEQLHLDANKAKLAAFFHDIGKSLDFEIDQNHVDAGIKIANECNLPDYIKEAIVTHHDEGQITSVYSHITKIADSISASRPGARIDSYEDYIKRVENLEAICREFEAVNYAYAIKSGRQLRIMVNPKKISNYNELEILALNIKKRIEADSELKTYKIKVILIKEDKISFETSSFKANQNT